MIEYRPHLIIARELGVYPNEWTYNLLPLYEHFARATLDLFPSNLECLNNTSSIYNSELHGFASMEAVRTTLARFFVGVVDDGMKRDVLSRCGIRSVKDLTKPIRLPGWDRSITICYDVRERKLKKSWNKSHPDAVYGQYAYFQFTTDRRWSFKVEYGYSRDSSSWQLVIHQHRRESLHSFGCRVEKWIEELFDEESPYGTPRRCYENNIYDNAHSAVHSVFYPDFVNFNEKLIELLCKGNSSGGISAHKIRLDKQRLKVIQRWIANDARRIEK
jgi:hypothetical protein